MTQCFVIINLFPGLSDNFLQLVQILNIIFFDFVFYDGPNIFNWVAISHFGSLFVMKNPGVECFIHCLQCSSAPVNLGRVILPNTVTLGIQTENCGPGPLSDEVSVQLDITRLGFGVILGEKLILEPTKAVM